MIALLSIITATNVSKIGNIFDRPTDLEVERNFAKYQEAAISLLPTGKSVNEENLNENLPTELKFTSGESNVKNPYGVRYSLKIVSPWEFEVRSVKIRRERIVGVTVLNGKVSEGVFKFTTSLDESVVAPVGKPFRLTPIEDTSTYEDAKTTPFGTYPDLWTSGYTSWLMRTYIKFDISSIPQGAKIKSAKLYLLKTYINSYGQDHTFTVRRCLNEWKENTLTFNMVPTLSANFYGPVYTFGAVNKWTELDMTQMVQEWVDGTYPNYGMRTTYNGTGYRENSRWASSNNPTVDCRPYMEVVYEF